MTNLKDHISTLRLKSQYITGKNKNTSIRSLADHMGAMQAQDFNMVKWAFGVRIPGIKERDVDEALNKGEIIRTHVLRPTWHIVAPENLRWMIDLSAPRIRMLSGSRQKQLGLTPAMIKKSNTIIEKALSKGNHLTRDEIIRELQRANIPTDENRASHFLIEAELECIICSGRSKGKKPTYALFEERIPKVPVVKKEEAMARLALKYFTSHYPATTEDFSWWSGLSLTQSKRAIEMAGEELISENIDSQTYWFPGSCSFEIEPDNSIRVLPAFDEFIISYKDRGPSLSSVNHKKAISTNGIFRAVIVKNGIVIGIWKRMLKAKTAVVKVELFKSQNKDIMQSIEKAFQAYGEFLEKDIHIDF